MFNQTSRLIRNGALEVDLWQLYDNATLTLPPDEAHWMITLDNWNANRNALETRKNPIAILISSCTEPNNLLPLNVIDTNAQSIAFIAIGFPTYTDGRGFSLAQILRKQYGWAGELRAVGDVLIDTIHYLARCGFDSFLVKEGHDPELALKSFETFTVHYQKSYLKPVRINS
jgi:uncharacterized protein (DUF934 family)